jgi:PAS domain S-box-containing protein
MKKTIIILFFFPIFALSQNIDSLKNTFNYDYFYSTNQLYNTTKKLIKYYKFRYPDSAIFYCNLLIKKATEKENPKQQALAYESKAQIFQLKKEYFDAINNYFSALKYLPKTNTRQYSSILIKIACSMFKANFNQKYIKRYIKQAIEISSDSGQIETKSKALAILSVISAKNKNMDTATALINKAVNLILESTNQLAKASIFYDFAKIYIHQKEYIKATTYLKKCISLTDNTSSQGFYSEKLADIYVSMGFYEAALNVYKDAEQIYSEFDDNLDLCSLYLNLSKMYYSQENYNEAIKYAQRALRLSKYLNLQYYQQQSFYQLSQIYNTTQKIDLALISFKQYSAIRDSLFLKKMENEGNLLYNNYIMQLKLKDRQLLFKQKQYQILKNKQQKLAIYILTISGILLILVILILLYLYNMRRMNEIRLKELTDASFEGIIIHDGQKIYEVNDKFCEISGYQRKELIGKSNEMILAEESIKLVREKSNLKKTIYYQIPLKRKNGSIYDAEVLSKPFIFKGKNAKVVSIRDLSELKKIKEKLSTAQEKFKTMIETSPDGVVIINQNGTITYASPAFAKIFAFDNKNELIGKNILDFFDIEFRNKLKNKLDILISNNFDIFTEIPARNKNDKKLFIECNGNYLKNKNQEQNDIFLIVRDITERKLIENALIESESRFRGLFNNSKDAILLQNKNNLIVDVNPSAIKLLKYSYKELLNFDFRQLLQDDKKNINFDEFIKENKPFETYIYTKNGKKIYIQVSISLLTYRKKEYYLLSIRDLTTFKRQEDRLRRVANKLMESNATKDKMFSIIAHDLRGPIGNLKTMIEFIAENPEEFDPAELVETIQSLRESSSQTYELLENLLSWAKSQQNLLEYNPKEFNLINAINETIQFTSQLAKNKKIEIITNFSAKFNVLADENMIRTVIRNLLSNAIKFTHKGGKIYVFTEDYQNSILIKIQDTGIGIPDKELYKLFDKNNYHSTYGTNNEKGTGLGLKLCYEFVTKNNGKIWVNSQVNKGTTFFFTIRKA